MFVLGRLQIQYVDSKFYFERTLFDVKTFVGSMSDCMLYNPNVNEISIRSQVCVYVKLKAAQPGLS